MAQSYYGPTVLSTVTNPLRAHLVFSAELLADRFSRQRVRPRRGDFGAAEWRVLQVPA